MAQDPNNSDHVTDQPAENEPWWPEFVQAYGQVSLRELARRFDTNPRRLRRAAHRSGLTTEPEVIRNHLEQLGQVADAELARELGVTQKAIEGARRRRSISALAEQRTATTRPVSPKPRETSLQAPQTPPRVRRNRRFEPPSAIVVVRKGSRAQVVETQVPAPLARVPGPTTPPPVIPETESSSPESKANENPYVDQPPASSRKRRRIVKVEERPEAPKPSPKKKKPRRAQIPIPPVKIVFDRKTAQPAEEEAAATKPPAPPAQDGPPAPPRKTTRRKKAPSKSRAPRTRRPSKPTPVAARPSPTLPQPLWIATIEGSGQTETLYIEAADLLTAASRASSEGTVLSVQEVPTL